jgi:hypothetical protein
VTVADSRPPLLLLSVTKDETLAGFKEKRELIANLGSQMEGWLAYLLHIARELNVQLLLQWVAFWHI